MNTLTAVVNNVVVLTEKKIQVKLGKNWFNIVEPDLTFWQGSLNKTVQVSFKELEQIHTEMFLNVVSVRQVKMLKSNELTMLEGTVTKVSLIPNHDNAINIEIGGITVGAARIPLLNVVGVVPYPFISQSEDILLHEWRYTSQEPQSNYTKKEVAEKLHLNPNHPSFHEAGRLDNDIALTIGKPKRNRKVLKAKRKAAKRRK